MSEKMSEERPSIPEFFAGRAVFITGATGFMGKVLVEKLLRSCPELRTIYVLMRTKKGAAPELRLRELTKQSLFDQLRTENPAAFDKLRPISGDVTELGLGLSAADRSELQAEVSVVFHSAASVRFDDPIRDAVIINVRGPREMIDLALGMRQLVVLVHLSTAYSNCHYLDVEEKLYPAPGDWRKMIQLAESSVDDLVFDCLTTKLTGERPNTYTYTKALGEHVVNDFRSQLPVVIVRPSIVCLASREPYCGWVDNVNGPSGMFVGGITGFLGNWSLNVADICLDYVPVDAAIKSIICIAWHTGLQNTSFSKEVVVYNCTTLMEPIKQQEFIYRGVVTAKTTPMSKLVWYPNENLRVTTSRTLFWISIIFFHMLPGYFLDAILQYNGQKPMLTKVYRRIYSSSKMIRFFTHLEFHFRNDRFMAVGTRIKSEDRTDFGYTKVFRWQDGFLAEACLGIRRSLLQDPLSTLPQAKAKQQRLYWVDWGLKSVLSLALAYIVVTNATLQAACTHVLSTLSMFLW